MSLMKAEQLKMLEGWGIRLANRFWQLQKEYEPVWM